MAISLPALVLSWKKSFGGIINFKPASPQNRDFSMLFKVYRPNCLSINSDFRESAKMQLQTVELCQDENVFSSYVALKKPSLSRSHSGEKAAINGISATNQSTLLWSLRNAKTHITELELQVNNYMDKDLYMHTIDFYTFLF